MHNGGNLLRPLRYENIQILRNPKQHVSWLTVDADIVSNKSQTKLAHREYRTKHQITEIRLVTNWKQKSGPFLSSDARKKRSSTRKAVVLRSFSLPFRSGKAREVEAAAACCGRAGLSGLSRTRKRFSGFRRSRKPKCLWSLLRKKGSPQTYK